MINTKQLVATALAALTGFAGLGFASSAEALEHQPFIRSEVEGLLEVIQETGHEIFVDEDICYEEQGLFGMATGSKELLVCASNHGQDWAELADTIRHEAVHLAQYCKGRRVGATIALLVPDKKEEYIPYAAHVLNMPMSLYPEDKWAIEAEARTMAYHLEEEQVSQILRHECGV